MSELGQPRHFGCVPITSGLPSTPDMSLHRSNRRFVPTTEVQVGLLATCFLASG